MTDRNRYRIKQLRDLIDEHGVDAVSEVTGLSLRTVLEYAGESARVIPLGKLAQAQKKLTVDVSE